MAAPKRIPLGSKWLEGVLQKFHGGPKPGNHNPQPVVKVGNYAAPVDTTGEAGEIMRSVQGGYKSGG